MCVVGAAQGGPLPNPAGDLAVAGRAGGSGSCRSKGAEHGKTYRYAAHRALEGGGARYGTATIPEGLNKAAASKVGASLVTRKLMREVQSKPDMPVWLEDEEGRGTSLIITR